MSLRKVHYIVYNEFVVDFCVKKEDKNYVAGL